MHELAQENFQANLKSAGGEAARAYLARRGVAAETIERFGLGYSDRSGRALMRLLEAQDFSAAQVEESGLVGKRQDGSMYDRFRNRLMFPIHDESGRIIAFGGRALAAEDEPKYLNSPETAIYKKSRVLYNLHRAKEAIRKEDRVILVEGYMDAIGVSAAGFPGVVASCGTSLTSDQIQALARHSRHMVMNFDPDPAGANATEKRIDALLQEGMQVRILELDGGLDPDEYCKDHGAEAYAEKLRQAKGYFHWLADRARGRFDVHTSEGLVSVLKFLLPAVNRISDLLVELLAEPADLALGDAVHPHGLNQIVDRAGRDALDIGLLHDRGERLLRHPARLEEAREIAALAQLGNAQLHRSGARLPIAVAVAVALRQTVGRAFAMGRAGAALNVQLHQALGGKADHLAQKIGVGGLFQKRLKGHSLVGHRGFLGCVDVRNPTLPENQPMTAASRSLATAP